MKFKIWEKILNEVVGASDQVLLGEVEADSFESAHAIARHWYPGKSTLRIDDSETAVEFESLEGN